MTLSHFGERPSGWERWAKKMGLSKDRPILDAYYALFFNIFGTGFGSIFCATLAFSFAENSCFTLRAIASVSTL
jgi:hypothetical protein